MAWLLAAVLVGLGMAWICAPTGTRGAPTHPLTDRLSESALTRAPDGRATA